MKPNTALRLIKPRSLVDSRATELEISMREFLVAFKQADKSAATLEKYGWHLVRLAAWLHERGVIRPEQMTRLLLREWGAGLNDAWAAATVKQAVCAARAYLKYCREEQLLDEALADCLKLPKVESGAARVLDIGEARAVIESLDLTLPLDVRDLAIVSLLIDSGLRASELCRLREADLKFGVQLYDPLADEIVTINTLSVIRKGRKRKRVAYFYQETAERIRAWQQIRCGWAGEGTEELFVSLGGTKRGDHLTRDGLRVILRNVARRCGVAHFSPHALRRTFAQLLDFAGASSRKIQLFGDWSSIAEVETYTRGLQVGSQYARYSPARLIEKLRGSTGSPYKKASLEDD